MADLQHRARVDTEARARNGRVLGWISGLSLLVVPEIAAGVLATAGTMVGPGGWDAERTFGWFLLATLLLGLGWVAYGSVRIGGFRRGAVPATAIAAVVLGAIYVLGVVLA